MVEKITLNPRKVRGVGNIVMEKDRNQFLPVNCRPRSETGTVNGVSRNVFYVDSASGGLISTYLTVSGPESVGLTDETITYTVSVHKSSDDSKITGGLGLPVKCFANGETYTVNTDPETGDAVFTVTNDFSEGNHTLNFVYNQISDTYANSYEVVTLLVSSGEVTGLELIPVKRVIQEGVVSPLVARLTSDGFGVKGKTLYFFEQYLKYGWRLSLDKFVVQSGDTVTATVKVVDSDGSGVEGETVRLVAFPTVGSSFLVGEGVTGSDGTKTFTYTSAGLGDTIFRGNSEGQGDALHLLDCSFYDRGTSTDYHNWTGTDFTGDYFIRGDDYTTLIPSDTFDGQYKNIFSTDTCIEFDIWIDYTTPTGVISFRQNGTNKVYFSQQELGLVSQTWHHIQLKVNSQASGTIRAFVDNEARAGKEWDADINRFYFVLDNTKANSLRYKNFKIYPID